jgi:hypothetical protein
MRLVGVLDGATWTQTSLGAQARGGEIAVTAIG